MEKKSAIFPVQVNSLELKGLVISLAPRFRVKTRGGGGGAVSSRVGESKKSSEDDQKADGRKTWRRPRGGERLREFGQNKRGHCGVVRRMIFYRSVESQGKTGF